MPSQNLLESSLKLVQSEEPNLNIEIPKPPPPSTSPEPQLSSFDTSNMLPTTTPFLCQFSCQPGGNVWYIPVHLHFDKTLLHFTDTCRQHIRTHHPDWVEAEEKNQLRIEIEVIVVWRDLYPPPSQNPEQKMSGYHLDTKRSPDGWKSVLLLMEQRGFKDYFRVVYHEVERTGGLYGVRSPAHVESNPSAGRSSARGDWGGEAGGKRGGGRLPGGGFAKDLRKSTRRERDQEPEPHDLNSTSAPLAEDYGPSLSYKNSGGDPSATSPAESACHWNKQHLRNPAVASSLSYRRGDGCLDGPSESSYGRQNMVERGGRDIGESDYCRLISPRGDDRGQENVHEADSNDRWDQDQNQTEDIWPAHLEENTW